ncbi:hypothetical protein D3C80_574880 [compost metagenome]
MMHQALEFGTPTQFDQILMAQHLVQQKLLDIILLQVDHRRKLLVIIHQHVELHHHLALIKAASTGPGETLADKGVCQPQFVEDLQAAAGDARRPAAGAYLGIILHHQ